MQQRSLPPLPALALLIGLGLAGNYFSVPFFFGVDFLFGSIATLVVIRLFGTAWGMLTALCVSGYTYALWGHPLGLTLYVLEALVVGLLSRRWQDASLILLDGAFWAIVGMPLIWIGHSALLHVDPTGVALIALKQAVNGLFNSLVAVVVTTYLPLNRWFLGADKPYRLPARQAVFTVLVAFLLLPTLSLIVISSRHELAMIRREIETLLSRQSLSAIASIRAWRERNMRAVAELSRTAAQQGMQPTTALQESMGFLLSASPEFRRLAVFTPDGTIVAARGEETSSPASVDTVNLDALRQRPTTVISDTHTTAVYPTLPVVTISEPVIQQGRLVGIAQGLLDLHHTEALLRENLPPQVHVTLLDSKGHVIATSRPDLSPLQPFDRTGGGGQLAQLEAEGRYQRFPAGEAAAVNRWRDSHEVLETPLDSEGKWILITEVSLAPYRTRLYRGYIQDLVIVLGLTLAALALSALLSRWITRPLLELTAITRYLPQRLQMGEPIRWPTSPLAEIDSLVADIRWMETALREQFDEIEQEAKQQRVLLSTAVEATDVPVIILDHCDRIVYANPPFLERYGYTADEVLGRRPLFLMGPLTDRTAVGQLWEALRLGRRMTCDLVLYRKEGTAVDVAVMLSPIRDGEGRVTHYVCIERDISARRQVQRLKSQLVTSLAQALRTPLTAVRGVLGLLSTQAVPGHDPRTGQLLQTATGHIERMVTLMNDLLAYEEIESGRALFHPKTHPANLLVQQAAEQVRTRSDQARVTLEMQVDPLPVIADAERVVQALTYLLTHAVDACAPGSRITLTARPEAGEVLFTMRVRERPSPVAQPDRVFQAFDQGELRAQSLGPAIARAVIEQLGGRIWVESAMGGGSNFCFTLPGAPVPEQGHERPAGATVLLYAEPATAEQAAQILRQEGFAVRQAHSADEAWDALSEQAYDALLLDPRLPEGRSFCEELKRSLRHADIPVVTLGNGAPPGAPSLKEALQHALTK